MDIESILRKTLKPALGCTEPVAIALAVAAAIQSTGGWAPGQEETPIRGLQAEDVESIRVSVNRNIFKNAFSIYIPNTGGQKGILMAAALGVWCDPGAGLELFRDIQSDFVTQARRLIDGGRISVEIVPADHTDLFIEARVRVHRGSDSHEGVGVIEDEHTNLVLLQCDGVEVFRRAPTRSTGGDADEIMGDLATLTLEDLVHMADNLPESVHPLLRKAIELNTKVAEAGLDQPLGLGVGYHSLRSEEGPERERYLSSGAAAGSDARMSGCPIEVMSSAGSGNQGIIATIPVYAYCRGGGVGDTQMLQAVALSHLVTMYVTTHIGYL